MSTEKSRAFGVDIEATAAEAVVASVRQVLRSQIKEIAQEAAESALTDDVVQELHEQAASAAQLALLEVEERGDEGSADDTAAPALQFANCEQFLREFVTVVYPRRVGASSSGLRWSREWWKYAEAISRVDSLWRAYEQLRHEPGTGMAIWWRDYLDPTMRELTSPTGAFWNAPKDELVVNENGDQWQLTPAPEGVFPRYE